MLSIILLYAVSASTFMISKQLLAYSTPLFLSGLRTLLAGFIFLFYLKYRGTIDSYKKYIFPCLSIGFFSFYMSNTLKFWALHHLTSGKASLIAVSEPFFAILFAYLLCNETMTLRRWLGLALCMIGASMVALSNFTAPFNVALPDIVMLGSIIASSFGALLMRKFVRINNYSAPIINCMSMGSAGICALFTSFILENPLSTTTTLPTIHFLSLLFIMVLVSNIFAYSLYGSLLTQYSAILISSASLLRPFFVACYSGTLDLHMLFSTAIISMGLLILYQEEKPSETTSDAPSLLQYLKG